MVKDTDPVASLFLEWQAALEDDAGGAAAGWENNRLSAPSSSVSHPSHASARTRSCGNNTRPPPSTPYASCRMSLTRLLALKKHPPFGSWIWLGWG